MTDGVVCEELEHKDSTRGHEDAQSARREPEKKETNERTSNHQHPSVGHHYKAELRTWRERGDCNGLRPCYPTQRISRAVADPDIIRDDGGRSASRDEHNTPCEWSTEWYGSEAKR